MWKNIALPEKVIAKRNLLHLVVVFLVIYTLAPLGGNSLIDWDEGVFALQGKWIASLGSGGKPFNFQTPPLYQIMIAILFRVIGVHDFALYLLSLVFSVLSIYAIYLFVRRFWSEEEGIFAVLFFVASEFFLFFSRSGLSDATFLFFFLGAIFSFMVGIDSRRHLHFVLSGLFTTLALYTKYSAVTLPIMFLIVLVRLRMMRTRAAIYSAVLPVILYLPYLAAFSLFITLPQLTQRHLSLISLNHLKYVVYLLIFAPVPLVLATLYLFLHRGPLNIRDRLLLLFATGYFLALGFYRPYFRLLYPMIPLLSIVAAHLVREGRRFRYPILISTLVIAMILGMKTILYHSDLPRVFAGSVDRVSRSHKINMLYAVVPPNITFYLAGDLAVATDHPWYQLGKRFPTLLRGKKVVRPEINELSGEDRVLIAHATILDSLKAKFDFGTLLMTEDFVDAPVYYKDIYNPQRNIRQAYEVYQFERESDPAGFERLWDLGFYRGVELITDADP